MTMFGRCRLCAAATPAPASAPRNVRRSIPGHHNAVIASWDMRALSLLALMASAATAQTLDYQFFKERVQPIFLKQRAGHARCVSCHAHGSPPLEPLAPGAETWTEEQSRKNFAVWKLFVKPGDPAHSPML